MVASDTSPRFGPFILTRPLHDGPLGPRCLALHESDSTSHVLTRVPLRGPRGTLSGPGFVRAVESVSRFAHPHATPVEHYGEDGQHGWIVSPFYGDRRGIATLATLLREKGGYLVPVEARHAVVQLLEVARDAHARGLAHGPMELDEIIIDRSGSVLVEHYGLGRALGLDRVPAGLDGLDSPQAEVRSIVELGYLLVTGLVPETPVIAASRVVPGLEDLWDDWFDTGLVSPRAGGPGFKSAAHALSAIAPAGGAVVRRGAGGVRVALRSLLVGV